MVSTRNQKNATDDVHEDSDSSISSNNARRRSARIAQRTTEPDVKESVSTPQTRRSRRLSNSSVESLPKDFSDQPLTRRSLRRSIEREVNEVLTVKRAKTNTALVPITEEAQVEKKHAEPEVIVIESDDEPKAAAKRNMDSPGRAKHGNNNIDNQQEPQVENEPECSTVAEEHSQKMPEPEAIFPDDGQSGAVDTGSKTVQTIEETFPAAEMTEPIVDKSEPTAAQDQTDTDNNQGENEPPQKIALTSDEPKPNGETSKTEKQQKTNITERLLKLAEGSGAPKKTAKSSKQPVAVKPSLPSGADIMRNIPRGKCKSGREWREPKSNPRYMYMDKGLKMPLEKITQLRLERQRVKELENRFKEEEKARLAELQRRRELNKKREEENSRRGEVVQVIRNTNKIKRMKKKQLRLLQKRDTTVIT